MENKKLKGAGILLGVGIGGFIDGIVFHQILQLHSMLSAILRQDNIIHLKTSMVWDGFFHAFALVAVIVGLKMLWEAMKVPGGNGKQLIGSMCSGWGIFNLVEGLVDHHLIGIHHVVEQKGESGYDYLFLLFGVILIIIGLMMTKRTTH